MTADKGKKQKVAVEKGEEQIDGELVLSIEKLQEIQDELEKINEKASDEVLTVEQKYIQLRKPVYDNRKEIIQSIPEFWLTAFLSHPSLSQILTDEDQKIFKYLESLEVEESKDVKMDFAISFNFNANPYFENSKLSKTFNFLDEGVVKVSATPIKWKEGKGISNGAKDEKKGNKRPLDEESFFCWFEESEEVEEMSDQIADLIKEDLWPNPLSYFNNEGEDLDDEDEDSEDDNDDEDADDDDEE